MFSGGSCRSSEYIETKDRESISCNLTQVSSSFPGDRWIPAPYANRVLSCRPCASVQRCILGNCEEPWRVAVSCCPQGVGHAGVCPRGLSSAPPQRCLRPLTGRLALLCATVWTTPCRMVSAARTELAHLARSPRNAICRGQIGTSRMCDSAQSSADISPRLTDKVEEDPCVLLQRPAKGSNNGGRKWPVLWWIGSERSFAATKGCRAREQQRMAR